LREVGRLIRLSRFVLDNNREHSGNNIPCRAHGRSRALHVDSGPLHLPPPRLGLGQYEQGYRDGDEDGPVDYHIGERKGQVPANPLDQLRGIGGGGEVGQIAEGEGNVGDRIVHGRDGGENSRDQPREGEALHDVAGEGGERVADGDRSDENKQQYRHEFEDSRQGQGQPEGSQDGEHYEGGDGVDDLREGDPYHVDEPAGGGAHDHVLKLKIVLQVGKVGRQAHAGGEHGHDESTLDAHPEKAAAADEHDHQQD